MSAMIYMRGLEGGGVLKSDPNTRAWLRKNAMTPDETAEWFKDHPAEKLRIEKATCEWREKHETADEDIILPDDLFADEPIDVDEEDLRDSLKVALTEAIRDALAAHRGR